MKFSTEPLPAINKGQVAFEFFGNMEPDRDGRRSCAIFWVTDYHPNRPDEKGPFVRVQHFFTEPLERIRKYRAAGLSVLLLQNGVLSPLKEIPTKGGSAHAPVQPRA